MGFTGCGHMSFPVHPYELEHAASTLTHYLVRLLFICSLGFYSAAITAALKFSRRLQKSSRSEFTPHVSILKPVHGTDFGSAENFASFCTQNYPSYEILFAANEETDPALQIVRALIAEYPERKIRILTGAPFLGENRKVNNLALMAREASHEILVITDGDVRVSPDYLRNVVAPFADNMTGAVTSLYRGVVQPNVFAELEALGAATDFAAGVLVAERREGLNFALGASIVTTKSWIQRIGGLDPIAQLLADDYELGRRVAAAGGEVLLSREVVATMYPVQTLRAFCVLAHTAATAAICLGAYLLLRFSMAFTVGVGVLQDQTVRRRWWLIPLRDAIHFIVWLASFASNRVTWGDTQFVMKNGQMIPVRNS